MVSIRLSSTVVALAALSTVQGLPLYKRIAQVISDSTQQWEKACDAAGGGEQCNPISVTAFSTLLAAAGPCEQQNAADSMIDLAKTLNNDADMIKFAQIFAQQPRNTPTSQAVPYCQQAPKNSELNGLFQCQFQSADETTFVGGLAAGSNGTIPFGLSSPVSPAGSCPANLQGPIADGSQLVSITQDPGLQNIQGGSDTGNATSSTASPSSTDTGSTTDSTSTATSTDSTSSTDSVATATSTDSTATSTATSVDSGSDSSDCSDDGSGDDDGSISSTDGSDSSDTSSDDSGSDSSDDSSSSSDAGSATATATATSDDTSATATTTASASDSSSTATTSDFQLQNGKDAQVLNAKFATLTADSPCTDGDQACIGNGFAQCVGGKFEVTECAGGLMCAALPLVNKAGTSLSCDTQADVLARIQATGAQGGITGN
ncbi:hypothetical protein ABKN59_009450 [Abortiporus biennis]